MPFIPGSASESPRLLARYTPPLPAGLAAAWAAGLPPGAALLDPFGAAPHLDAELARAGRTVLVAANNPITRFLLELAAEPPTEAGLRAALAELGAARKGDERLEPHIRGLYATGCARCTAPVEAQAFIWERGADDAPFLTGKIYHCQECGDSGEHPAAPEDQASAARFPAGGLHRARALERVALADDPDRVHAEEALEVYIPRALYILFTIVNKLDSLLLPPGGRRGVQAMLLHAFDQANTLWPHPSGRARPRQLTIPPRFRENNIWLALEESVTLLGSSEQPTPLAAWPAQPPDSGGIILYEGRLRDLAQNIQAGQAQPFPTDAVLAALPRPNQAFWTLSALWAGWLWGREAIGPFKSVLRRRRYDWGWHTAALNSAFENLAGVLQPGAPLLGLIGENEPGFLAAALLGAAGAGFALDEINLSAPNEQAQLEWRMPAADRPPANEAAVPPGEALRSAAIAILRARGEPSSFQRLQAAGLLDLARRGLLAPPGVDLPERLGELNRSLEETLSYRQGFLRFGGSDKSLDVGLWWHRDLDNPAQPLPPPLADRVEMDIVRLLAREGQVSFSQVEQAIYPAYPGLLTPARSLLAAVLDSYATPSSPESQLWALRPEDAPGLRRGDLDDIRRRLTHLGEHLGYQVSGEKPLVWSSPGGPVQVRFYIIVSAVIGETLVNAAGDGLPVIVFPGGRAALLLYKLEQNPRLKQAAQHGLRWLKFRLARTLSENPSVSPENFLAMVDLDPLSYSASQLPLL